MVGSPTVAVITTSDVAVVGSVRVIAVIKFLPTSTSGKVSGCFITLTVADGKGAPLGILAEFDSVNTVEPAAAPVT